MGTGGSFPRREWKPVKFIFGILFCPEDSSLLLYERVL
jgi:hypothetical protein